MTFIILHLIRDSNELTLGFWQFSRFDNTQTLPGWPVLYVATGSQCLFHHSMSSFFIRVLLLRTKRSFRHQQNQRLGQEVSLRKVFKFVGDFYLISAIGWVWYHFDIPDKIKSAGCWFLPLSNYSLLHERCQWNLVLCLFLIRIWLTFSASADAFQKLIINQSFRGTSRNSGRRSLHKWYSVHVK